MVIEHMGLIRNFSTGGHHGLTKIEPAGKAFIEGMGIESADKRVTDEGTDVVLLRLSNGDRYAVLPAEWERIAPMLPPRLGAAKLQRSKVPVPTRIGIKKGFGEY